jgi:hypothetical protein
MKIIEFKTTKELQVEKKRAYNIQYKIDNKERLIQYRIDNKEAIAKSRAKYRIKNKERINAQISQYKKDNKGAINNINARRRARKVSATPSYSNKEQIKAIYEQSSLLTKQTGIQHHVDHIIPLQGKLVSGFHIENNLQILPALDNITKNNSYIPVPDINYIEGVQ